MHIYIYIYIYVEREREMFTHMLYIPRLHSPIQLPEVSRDSSEMSVRAQHSFRL